MDQFPSLPIKSYEKIRHEIQSGDILLCSGTAFFSRLIQQATNSIWSHVGFIMRLDNIDRIMIFESVESIGVRAVPLSSYATDYNATGFGYPGRVMIARHQNCQQKNMVNLSKFAVDLLGYPYNTDEIVSIAARIGMNSLGLNDGKDDEPKRSFICSEYAYHCFKSVGIHIEYNPLGFIAPEDFARDARVKPLCFIETVSEDLRTKQSEFA